jgi:hypothetical protein
MQHIAQEGRCFVITGKPIPNILSSPLDLTLRRTHAPARGVSRPDTSPPSSPRSPAHPTANQYHSPADFPADYPPSSDARVGPPQSDKTTPEAWSRGGSAIIGPLGDVLAGPLWDKEGILYADVSGIEAVGGVG